MEECDITLKEIKNDINNQVIDLYLTKEATKTEEDELIFNTFREFCSHLHQSMDITADALKRASRQFNNIRRS